MTKQKTDAQLKADMDAKQRAKEAVAAKKAERASELDKPLKPGATEGGLAPDVSIEAQKTGQDDAFIPPAPVEPVANKSVEALLAETVERLKDTEVSLSALEKRIDAVERGLKGLGVGAKRKVDDGTHVGSIDGLGQI